MQLEALFCKYFSVASFISQGGGSITARSRSMLWFPYRYFSILALRWLDVSSAENDMRVWILPSEGSKEECIGIIRFYERLMWIVVN